MANLTSKQVKNLITCIILAIAFSAVLVVTNGMTEVPPGMPEHIDMRGAYIAIAVLIVAFVLFFTEVFPLAVTSMLVPIALAFPGIEILSGKTAFENFGDDWVVCFMAIFIVGDAIFRTGLAEKIGKSVLKMAGTSPRGIIVVMGVVMGLISAVLSNSATMALFAPIIVSAARTSGLKPSQVLMPMAFFTCIGGNMTLLGASSKGVINGIMENMGLAGFGFFDYTPIGVVLFGIAGVYYWFIGWRFLPVIEDTAADNADVETLEDDRSGKQWWALFGFGVTLVTMASGIMAPPLAAMVGMVIVVVSGCVTMTEAYNAVSWTTIFLFAGMLALGQALVATGADAMIAHYVSKVITSPVVLLVAVYVLTMLLTNFMSNTASAAVAAPIAISCAAQFGVSALPYCMAVGIASSLCFMTPIATPANTIAFGLGGYKFKDFATNGGVIQLIMTVAGLIIIPIFFPF